jgi:regulator of cell morphogenesis and NO signaling
MEVQQMDDGMSLETTVNAVIARHPRTIAVFNEYGIDGCCGGEMTIADAAREQGLAPAVLMHVLRRAAA